MRENLSTPVPEEEEDEEPDSPAEVQGCSVAIL